MATKFKLILGDWSGDGHGITEVVMMHTNGTLQAVREAYFKAIKKTGIDIGTICQEYEDGSIKEKDWKKLQELGYKGFNEVDEDYIDDATGDIGLEPDQWVDMFKWFVKQGDPKVTLSTKADKVDMFHWYGNDKKGRHLRFFGYGLFSR
jgi:hypothetical protein